MHAFRHQYAIGLLLNGATLTEVQDLLGHSSPTTTQRYTVATRQELGHAAAANPALKAIHDASH